ncbi:MAG: hypothetical protein K9N46_02035 [Candidatus Marinimicrobia bacterium]|nr:hypothetical protein [Candidatus Neomarinimicrobiota bacterium]MCF7828323.1 hypothetical protein [Candidatus Neomarinimicrobiota bacterium]MCF7879502.1 hypothetical protein [Candidatus Neomarinimicrobiota bacterium]
MSSRVHILIVGIVFAVIGLAASPTLQAQSEMTVETIQANLQEQFSQIEDYMARVKISVEMPGLRMPSKTIDVAFKQPDMTRIESSGIAIAPKTGLHMGPKNIFDNLQNARVVDAEYLNGDKHWVVTGDMEPDSAQSHMGVPTGGGVENVAATIWIDADRWVISRLEMTSNDKPLMTTDISYHEYNDIWLPAVTNVTFTFSGDMMGNLPTEHMPGSMEEGSGDDEGNTAKSLEGAVTMEFKNYRVNTGLKDSFFRTEDNR